MPGDKVAVLIGAFLKGELTPYRVVGLRNAEVEHGQFKIGKGEPSRRHMLGVVRSFDAETGRGVIIQTMVPPTCPSKYRSFVSIGDGGFVTYVKSGDEAEGATKRKHWIIKRHRGRCVKRLASGKNSSVDIETGGPTPSVSAGVIRLEFLVLQGPTPQMSRLIVVRLSTDDRCTVCGLLLSLWSSPVSGVTE